MTNSHRPGDRQGGGIGDAVERREDPALLKGEATFVDDIQERDMAHVAIVRSQFAHARIESIDTERAEAVSGVVGVFTAADLDREGVPGHIPPAYRLPGLVEPEHPILAREKVRYQGKPVAAVVAEDRYTAYAAADEVSVDYDRLDAVTEPKAALSDDAPVLHDNAPDNVCFDHEMGDADATDEAFEAADHTISGEFSWPRQIQSPIEPRGAIASYDAGEDELTVEMATQNPRLHQTIISDVLGLPQRKVRVKAPNVGGSFACKSMVYPEENIAAFCSMQLNRPVKFVETRTEGFLADEHGRGVEIDAEIAVNDDGSIQAIRVEAVQGLGGTLSTKGAAALGTMGTLLSGQYVVPAIHFRGIGAFTTATPTSAYRGVGRAQAAFTVERLVTLAARELDIDPAELRRRNFIPEDEFPYQTPVAMVYDSGDYETALDRALEMVGIDDFEDRKRALREEGTYLGLGISSSIEMGGYAPSVMAPGFMMDQDDAAVQFGFWESGTIRMHETGEVTAFTGTTSHGQGAETAFAQIVADELGVDPEDVEIVEGRDTKETNLGGGSFGSRSAVMGGNALRASAEKVIEKGRKLTAHELEAAEDDIEFEDGEFFITGATERSLTIQEVARSANLAADLPEGMEPGLEVTSFFDPPNMTFAFSTHVCVVEVDGETGDVDLLQFIGVDDCGVRINPKIVEGQEHGGIAAGIGSALYEGIEYADNGTILTGSYQDYAIPKATHVPDLDLDHTVTPSPSNPMGVKGKGEAGAIGAPAAIVNAVTDALQPFDVEHIDTPIQPERVWRAMNASEEGS